MADELVLAGEGGAAGAEPAVVAAVLLVGAEVGEDGEVLAAAAVAHVHLGAMAALVVVLCADHRLERLELGVPPVPPATLLRARVLPRRRRHRLVASLGEQLGRIGQRRLALVLVAVRAHVHPQVGVALEPLPAHLAVVRVPRQQVRRLQLHHVHLAVAVAVVVSAAAARRGRRRRGAGAEHGGRADGRRPVVVEQRGAGFVITALAAAVRARREHLLATGGVCVVGESHSSPEGGGGGGAGLLQPVRHGGGGGSYLLQDGAGARRRHRRRVAPELAVRRGGGDDDHADQRLQLLHLVP